MKIRTDPEIRIVHVMKDGTIRKSVAGLMVPADNRIYKILREYKQKEAAG